MSLFRLEFLRVCRSASYIAAVTALVPPELTEGVKAAVAEYEAAKGE